MNKNKGITLIALIITIIILLILAGITIGTLTGENGLFTRAQQAKEKTQESQEKENKTIENYIAQIDEMSDENTLVNKVKSGKIKIGDYVKYEPNSIDINSDEYKTLVSNWGETYSGSKNNSTANLIQDTTLNWRVLDIKDGKVRLISDKPTSNTVVLSGYQGYNNAVYLLDHTCKMLYSNSTLSNNVQNLKIEDIENYITNERENVSINYYTYEGSEIYYPMILQKEKIQKVNGIEGTLGISEQTTLINQTNLLNSGELNLTNNYDNAYEIFGNLMFSEEKYSEIFIKKESENFDYWLSSRCTHIFKSWVNFSNYVVNSGNIGNKRLYTISNIVDNWTAAFRPVITLNTEVKIDTEKTRDGNSAETAYVLK